jgi:hypothetical protein
MTEMQSKLQAIKAGQLQQLLSMLVSDPTAKNIALAKLVMAEINRVSLQPAVLDKVAK